MHYTRSWRSFSLTPSEGERGHTLSSIPRSYPYEENPTPACLLVSSRVTIRAL